MSSSKKILIVDFMYYWNRCYSVKGATTPEHVYKSLKHVDESDYYFYKAIVLDGLESTKYRRTMYPEYKTNRDDKSSNYDHMELFLEKYAYQLESLRFIKNDAFEADDIIAALVKRYDKCEKYIYSGDTDLYQLLRFKNTYIGTDFKRGMIITPIDFEEAMRRYSKKYNLDIRDASYIVKCKTFKGDSSDNIPVACPTMRSVVIDQLIREYWSEDVPLTPEILLNMANHLKKNGSRKDFENFFDNRKAIIRNYKLTQLGYNDMKILEKLQVLQEGGQWE